MFGQWITADSLLSRLWLMILWLRHEMHEYSWSDGADSWYGSKPLIMYSSVRSEDSCKWTKLSLCGGEISPLSPSHLWGLEIFCSLTEWCNALYMHTQSLNWTCTLLHRIPSLSSVFPRTESALFNRSRQMSRSVSRRGRVALEARVKGRRSADSDEAADCAAGFVVMDIGAEWVGS